MCLNFQTHILTFTPWDRIGARTDGACGSARYIVESRATRRGSLALKSLRKLEHNRRMYDENLSGNNFVVLKS